MASMSEEERLKAEIAKLSGAIQTHKQQQHEPYAGGYASRGRGYYSSAGLPTYRGAYTGGRGGFYAGASAGRGRGRGAAPIPLRNRTLILNDSGSKPAMSASASVGSSAEKPNTADAAATSSGSATSTPSSNATSSIAAGTTDGWIKRKSTHNMGLVSTSTFQRTEPARLAAMEATRKAKAQAKAAASSSSSNKQAHRSKPTKPSSSVRRGDNMGEVVIDGVVFEFDPSGTKLVKKPVQPSSSSTIPNTSASSTSKPGTTSTAVPLKTSINGQDYIRTKRGNLISAELLAKRKAQREAQAKMGRLDKMVGQISAIQATRNASARPNKAGSRTLDVKKARTLCTFFNKTGQCKRGLSCPYLHNSSKIALCPKVLRPAGCTLPKGTCPLSHTPRAERVPHCVHYLRSGQCRNGDECLYTHSDKLPAGLATKICRDFSDYGWCDKGKDCEERHTYECPDFVEKGKCERKGCKLVHIIRASQPNDGGGAPSNHPTAAGDDENDEGEGMQDGDLFMRDDAAAAEDSQDEHEPRKGKRKRPLMQTELDDDQLLLPDDNDDDDDEEDDEQVNFANVHESRSAKRRKAKAFTQQKDFISFDDDMDDEDVDDDDEVDDEESQVEGEVSDDDEDGQEEVEAGSVHSEDFELSDGGTEDDEDAEEDEDEDDEGEDGEDEEEEEGAEDAAQSGKSTAHQEDDDDDGLVDRDL